MKTLILQQSEPIVVTEQEETYRYVRDPQTGKTATFCILRQQVQQARGSSHVLDVSVAICSEHDRFDKAHGRELASLRMFGGEFVYVEGIQSPVDDRSLLELIWYGYRFLLRRNALPPRERLAMEILRSYMLDQADLSVA